MTGLDDIPTCVLIKYLNQYDLCSLCSISKKFMQKYSDTIMQFRKFFRSRALILNVSIHQFELKSFYLHYHFYDKKQNNIKDGDVYFNTDIRSEEPGALVQKVIILENIPIKEGDFIHYYSWGAFYTYNFIYYDKDKIIRPYASGGFPLDKFHPNYWNRPTNFNEYKVCASNLFLYYDKDGLYITHVEVLSLLFLYRMECFEKLPHVDIVENSTIVLSIRNMKVFKIYMYSN